MLRVRIVPNDISTVAKVVLIDNKNRVLLLKRSNYMEKFAGDWDLPGGHLRENENLELGLKREVKEETQLKIRNPEFFQKMDNLHFFYARYDSQEIILSDEHTEYKFFEKKELNPKEKFQKLALKALKLINDDK